jgi:hypothetical protein
MLRKAHNYKHHPGHTPNPVRLLMAGIAEDVKTEAASDLGTKPKEIARKYLKDAEKLLGTSMNTLTNLTGRAQRSRQKAMDTLNAAC